MLDVHAPQGKGHSWKDFLFHMAAIACGLLLALALEKIAATAHEWHLLSQSRSELAAELQDNRRVWEKNVSEAARLRKTLEANLKIIRALRSHAASDGGLDYSNDFYASRDGAWQSVQQNGSLSLMPHEELTKQAWFYRMLRDQMDSLLSLLSTLKIAASWAASAPPNLLDSQELEELERNTIEAEGRLDVVRSFLEIEESGLSKLSHATNAGKP